MAFRHWMTVASKFFGIEDPHLTAMVALRASTPGDFACLMWSVHLKGSNPTMDEMKGLPDLYGWVSNQELLFDPARDDDRLQ